MQLIALAGAAVAALSGLASAAPAAPYYMPSDGFPNPSAQQLDKINQEADGTLSNAPPPPSLNNNSIPVFQLITFNENFEVAYFGSLIYNITNNVQGYELETPAAKEELLKILGHVLAQEELHAINGANILKHFGGFVPTPCEYKFPVDNVRDAITLAETFTSLVMGTLQDGSETLAKNGDHGPVRAVASVIGQEGEQNGFYRGLLGRQPSQKPFLTTSVGAFAFSALQDFIVSCPFPISNIPIKVFTPLNVLSGNGGTNVDARDQHLTFSADLTSVAEAASYIGGSGNGLFVTYFTGQDTPVSEAITNVQWHGKQVTFEALFPFSEFVMEGFSVASLTVGGNFSNPDDVPAATLAAPGLINVNDMVE